MNEAPSLRRGLRSHSILSNKISCIYLLHACGVLDTGLDTWEILARPVETCHPEGKKSNLLY